MGNLLTRETVVVSVKDAREAEAQAEQIIRTRGKSRFGVSISSVELDSVGLDETAGIANFLIRGRVTVVVQPKGFLTPEKVEEHAFQMRLDAKDLKLLALEWID